jgi:cobalt-precorrin 5A hydrolase
LAAAKHFGLRVVPVDLSDMRGVATSTQSERILNKFGVGSLSEAVALTVAGGNARLLSPREISSDRMATAAIAEGDRT